MGKYHSELLMLFNLAFLMKCKYIAVNVIVMTFLGWKRQCNKFFAVNVNVVSFL